MAIKGRVPLYFIIVRIGDRAKAIIIIVTDIFFPTEGLAVIPSIPPPFPCGYFTHDNLFYVVLNQPIG